MRVSTFPPSLTRRTLVRVALGVTLIVVLSGAVTYHRIYQEIQQRVLEQLSQYTLQRSQSEAAIFALARDMQQIVRRAFLKQWPVYRKDKSVLARFDALFQRYPDGAYRSRSETIEPEDPVTSWIHRDTPLTPEIRRKSVLFYDLIQQFKPTALVRFTDIYFTAPEQINVGTDPPGVPLWALNAPPDYDMNGEEWVYIGDPVHDPEREVKWTGVLQDDVWQKLFVAIVTPIDYEGVHVANITNELFLDDMVGSLLQSGIDGVWHTVFRDDGRLIAHTGKLEAIKQSEGRLTIQDSQDPKLLALLADARRPRSWDTQPVASGYNGKVDLYYAVSRLSGPDWYFASAISGGRVRAEAFRSAQWAVWVGLGSLAFLLLILAAILRRQIAMPLAHLIGAVRSVAAGEARTVDMNEFDNARDEIGQLAGAFNEMVNELSQRDADLRVERQGLRDALNRIKAAEERFRALIEHGADIISVVDADGVIRYISPSVERVLGFPADEFIGKTLFEIIHPDDVPRLSNSFQKTLQQSSGPIAPAEYRRRHADGQWRWFEAIGINQLHNPAVGGVVVNARDITVAKEAEAEIARQRETLYQREKLAAMGSLLAGVAHELNNPLSIVVGRSIMLEEEAEDPTLRQNVERIRFAAERCARIVKTFLAMARQHQPEFRAVRVNAIVEACAEILAYGLRSSGIDLTMSLAAYLPDISADADQLHQVFLNLIVNAQQAMEQQPENREIHIVSGFAPQRNLVWVEVADTGPGIPEDIRSRIFDPYFTTKPVGCGTGVGLSVSLGIVEAHGGTLQLRCPPEGGAVFTVSLPAALVKEVIPPVPDAGTAEVAGHCRRHVLIVDDEAEVAELLSDILASDGHFIDIAASGREALGYIGDKGPYDAILSDLRMPEMDGPALYREILRRWPALAQRVIFVTGDTLSPNVQTLLEETACPVIEKPFLPEDIKRKLADVCEQVDAQCR